jgi:hypothetical protein
VRGCCWAASELLELTVSGAEHGQGMAMAFRRAQTDSDILEDLCFLIVDTE